LNVKILTVNFSIITPNIANLIDMITEISHNIRR